MFPRNSIIDLPIICNIMEPARAEVPNIANKSHKNQEKCVWTESANESNIIELLQTLLNNKQVRNLT